MAEPTMFRARYVQIVRDGYAEVELLSEDALAQVRLVDGTDFEMDADAFRAFYVPVYTTTVDLSEGTS